MSDEDVKQSRARTPEAKDERRTSILDAALAEFFERGFAQARMDDVAERAGVSKGTLYLYFPSKAAIFEGLVDTYARPNKARVAAVLAQPIPAIDRIRQLLTLAPTLIRRSDMPKLMKIMVSDSQTFPDLIKGYRLSVIEPMMERLEGVIAEGQAEGTFRDVPPRQMVRLVVAPILMSAMWRIVFETDPKAKVDLDSLFALHLETIERALLVEPPTR